MITILRGLVLSTLLSYVLFMLPTYAMEPGVCLWKPGGPRRCNTVKQAMNWAREGLDTLCTDDRVLANPRDDLKDIFMGRIIRLSSSFSGICSPELTMRIIKRVINALILNDVPADMQFDVSSEYAIEHASLCQEEILGQEESAIPDHLFNDQAEFLPKAVHQKLFDSKGKPREDLRLNIKQEVMSSTTRKKAWCVRHGDWCPISQSDLHVAGSHCTDHSTMGLREMDFGTKRIFLYIWARQRLDLDDFFIIHENVVTFGTLVLMDLLGSKYVLIARIVLCATLLGWATKRKRQFCILKHKGLIALEQIPACLEPSLEVIIQIVFYRDCCFTVAEYMIATTAELAADFAWAMSRKKVCCGALWVARRAG